MYRLCIHCTYCRAHLPDVPAGPCAECGTLDWRLLPPPKPQDPAAVLRAYPFTPDELAMADALDEGTWDGITGREYQL